MRHDAVQMNVSPGVSDVELALGLADVAEAIAMSHFRSGDVTARRKVDGSPVTDVDEQIERELFALVTHHRPHDGFLGEELGHRAVGERTWIVDPLDGTHAFLAGADTWGAQIALVHDQQVLAAVATWPARSSRWWIGADGGAYHLDAGRQVHGPLCASQVADLERVRWSCNPSLEYIDQLAAAVDEPASGSGQQRWDVGALAMLRGRGTYVAAQEWTAHPALMVAAGELDVCVQLGGGVWDHAAIAGILHAARGDTISFDQPDRRFADGAVVFTNAGVGRAYRASLSPRR
jgi:fructose-1,6-bisphosphatase/inositol monophosphatase family enzyme